MGKKFQYVVYKLTFPNGKIYIGKYIGSDGHSLRYFGSWNNALVEADFTKEELKDFSVRKEIIFESDDKSLVSKKEHDFIKEFNSHYPEIGYNRTAYKNRWWCYNFKLRFSVRILGIDPGLNHMGWGVVDAKGNALSYVASGVVSTSVKSSMHTRLYTLHTGLQEVIAAYNPDVSAIEETFVNMNGATTLKLGNARGAIMLSLAISGLEIHEYAARLVKKAVVGSGRAEKEQVASMVRVLLPSARADKADAMDALAIAICHANHRQWS
jgi:crossover junction endodeoxyribonuclease RuvC